MGRPTPRQSAQRPADVRPQPEESTREERIAASVARRTPARRGRDLPLPLLLLLAMVAVLGERFGANRRAPLVIALVLLFCVALGGVGLRVAGRGATPAVEPTAVFTGQGGPVNAPNADTPWPTPNPPAVVDSALVVPQAEPSSVPAAASSAPVVAAGSLAPPAVSASSPPAASAAPAAASGAPASAAPAPRGTTMIPILMYHYVRTVTDPKDTIGINLSVTPANFAAQMQYLADNGYTTLTMREVHAILAGELPLPPKPIALTFDDGYRDFYTAAWPVLQRHNFKSTNYVITSLIGQEPYMTWAMIQELDATGQVEIGAHTRTHADLRALSADKRWDEIVGSKAILEEGLGHPIASFCYPAGFYNAAVLADVRRAGFLTATTVDYGIKQHLQNAFEMPRIRVNGPDPLKTWAGKLP